MGSSITQLSQITTILLLCTLLAACGGSSSSDDNTAPTVDAGSTQTVNASETVTLSATITDDDTDFSVTWSQTSGTDVVLSDSSATSTTFTAPSSDSEETLVFEVSVDDGSNTAVSDSVTINVNAEDTSLTVDAGTDQTVNSEDLVTLSATISDSSATIIWSQSSGTSVTLSDNTSATLTFTAPAVIEDEELVFQISADDGINDPVTDTVSITVTLETISTTNDVWIINDTDETSENITDESTGEGVLVDVQSVTEESVSGKDYTVVSTQGIPKYDVTITQDIIDGLNDRPNAASDFDTGVTTTNVGDVVTFGEDIGYISTGDNCDSASGETGGDGYWPKGPACPQADERTVYFPVEPTETTEECENGLGKVGLFVNGSSIYNWGDGQSYNSDGSWQNLAPVAEQYDVDICGGHSANGDYHHHFYTSCLATLVGDEGDEHSPLYGYAADGYPIYGPWHSDGVLAISAWEVRDYSSTSDTGCSDDARSCTMVDQYDVTQGTESATDGPTFDEVVVTLSKNELVAVNGYYYEDYYWNSDLTDAGGAYLDKYNAHTDTERGYHYHVTLTEDDDTFSPAFPYIVGLRFAGELDDNAVASCESDDKGSSGGGPGS